MEKNKKDPYSELKKAYAELENIYPIARTYEVSIEGIPQPEEGERRGYTERANRNIRVDPQFKDTVIDTIAHELLHAEQLQEGRGSTIWDDSALMEHNKPFDDELARRKAILPMWKQQIDMERGRKLTPYEKLIKREQEALLGVSPDLIKK